MRGAFRDQGAMFSYISPEERIPAEHPLRRVRELVREVLKELSQGFWPFVFARRATIDPAGANY